MGTITDTFGTGAQIGGGTVAGTTVAAQFGMTTGMATTAMSALGGPIGAIAAGAGAIMFGTVIKDNNSPD
ncbi:MAG: hypothetical protein KTR28_01445 [Micavibrio sp.]|nr:hypothetical protein [Micavibrio sp.]